MNYVDEAKAVIENLYSDKRNKITTTKIRGLLSGISDIYNDVVQQKEDKLDPGIISRIDYLKVQFVYESGRDPKVRRFIDESKMIQKIEEIKGNKAKFMEMERYMEALVAYHKFYNGED